MGCEQGVLTPIFHKSTLTAQQTHEDNRGGGREGEEEKGGNQISNTFGIHLGR